MFGSIIETWLRWRSLSTYGAKQGLLVPFQTMRIPPLLRFPLILGGVLAAIGLMFWPVIRRTRQAAQRAGIT